MPPPSPPRLVKPNPPLEQQTFSGEETFVGYDADVLFQWEQDGRPLQVDEYYVLAVKHVAGTEYRWAGHYTAYHPPAAGEGSLGWLIDYADMAGCLRWQILVVRTKTPKQTGPPDWDDQIIVESAESTFRWVRPSPSKRQHGGTSGGGMSGGGIE